MGPGEHFLRDVYTALINSPRWQTTMLVVVHDEHSGTLDHTSILQLLAEKFAGDRRAYSDDVNWRLDQGIESLSSVLSPAHQ